MAYRYLFCSLFELLLLLVSQIKTKSISERENIEVVKCISLKADCMNDMNCFSSVMTVSFFCQGLFSGKGEICSEDCKYELGNFTMNDQFGRSMATCSCENDASCLTYRARGLRCFSNNMQRNRTGCSTMLRRCRRDHNCSALWEKFLLKCTHLISGTECTEECQGVQKELYSHRLLKNYETCECNGYVEEEKFCRGVRAHYNDLCLPKNKKNIETNELPNTAEVGTNFAEVSNGKSNQGSQIRSSDMMFGLTIITLISQAVMRL